jgi:hypothetical protein
MFDEIVTLITNVGFPIACCIVLFMQQGKLTKTLADLNTTLQVVNTRLDNIEDELKKRGD